MHSRGILPGTALLLAGAAVFFAAEIKLPAPFATPSVNNGPRVIPKPESAKLHLPPGFTAEVWAEGFEKPRFLLLGPSGELLVSDSAARGQGAVYVIHKQQRKKLIEGLDRPYGLAFWKDYLYVGEPQSVKRYPYDSRTMTAGAGQEVVSLAGFSGGHWTRTILFDREGRKMYVTVGSGSNVLAR